MPINVDTVYQRVLAIANKEQRGYITPQEFNLFANQAQLYIFEEYFHDLNQYLMELGNDSSYSDSVDYIEDKLSFFSVYDENVFFSPKEGYVPGGNADYEIYRIINVKLNGVDCQQKTFKDLDAMRKGVFAVKPHPNNPVYIRTSRNPDEPAPPQTINNIKLRVYTARNGDGAIMEVLDQAFFPNNPGGVVTMDYFKKPRKVEWDYILVNEKALYNANGSVNFELHPSEETTLVYRILEYAGIIINKPGLASYAKGELAEQSNNEKR